MLQVTKSDSTFLYRQVIDLINENIDSGTLRPGDRLPSLRKMSQTAGVSIPVSYTHLTLPTTKALCSCRWSRDH